MALRLWMGPSGCGKTYFLFKHILDEALAHPEMNYIVIVPEQFTLSTQRELIRLSADHGILNVDVLSFARLAYRVFEEVGFKDASGVSIDDMGKNLILRHVAGQCEEKLSVLSGKMNKLGYITEVKSVVSEFMQYGIGSKEITEMIENADKTGRKLLAAKLSDIKTLYEEFNNYIENKYITKEEILSKASKSVHRSNKLKNSVIVFDGFTGFTPVQYRFIESLLQISHDMYVTILTDTRDKITYNTEHELFYLGFKTSEKLKKLAELNNIHIENDFEIKEDIPRRYLCDDDGNSKTKVTSKMLVHLEKNLFRPYATQYKVTDKNTDGCQKPTKVVNAEIAVFTGLQGIDEVTKAAIKIRELIESGYRYKDIAIATGDLDNYIPIIKRVFSKYDIPYFIDKNMPILMNPFIEYIRALVSIIVEDFSYSSVLRYLRSPLSGVITDDIDEIENFVLKFGIRGYNEWNASWQEKYSRYYKKRGSSDEIQENDGLIAIDIIRQNMMENLRELTNIITGVDEKGVKNPTKTVNEINSVFMRVFDTCNIEKNIESLFEEYSRTDVMFEKTHKKEYEKIYSKVIELFSRMSELLGNEFVTLEEYGELLDAGFDEIRIGIIPTITDYIQIGDITRSRFQDVQALFIVGANDGVIPKSASSGGIISDIEKEFLIGYTPDIELSPTIREQSYTGQLYLYMLMTKPSMNLFVSYARLDGDGNSIRPSYIIKILTDMFPSVRLEKDFNDIYERVFNYNTCFDAVSENIRDKNIVGLITLLLQNADNDELVRTELLNMCDASFSSGIYSGMDSISKIVAGMLYGKSIVGSVTRLEQFARCSFSYFLKYGLSLKERELFGFEAKDMGSVFHGILEKYSRYISENNLSWIEVSPEQLDKIVDEAIDECKNDPQYAVLTSSFRNRYMTERIKRISLRSINVLTDHLRAGSFVPKGAEISFNSVSNLDAFTFKLSDDEIMRLRGTIDRLDTYEDRESGKVYIKVIDYKSGNKSFDLIEVYKGLSLQLVVYMNAAMEIVKGNHEYTNKEVIPAGILYYHIDDPIVSGSSENTDDEIYEMISKELKMKGLVNSDKDVYELIDSNIDSSSDIIPISTTKGGELSKTSSAVSTDDFATISNFVNHKIRQIGTDILSGNIKAEPHTAKGVDRKACEYCEYISICKFDEAKTVKSESEVTKDNVLEKMKEEA